MGKSNKPTKWFKAVKKAFRSPSKEMPLSAEDAKAEADEKLLSKNDLSPASHQAPTPDPLPSSEIVAHDEVEPEHTRGKPLSMPEAVDPAIPANLPQKEDNEFEEEDNTSSNVVHVVEQLYDDDDDSILSEEEVAAIRIQQRFSAPLASKGLIRLQALVRGHLVRRQAATTLRTMEAIVRLQSVFRGRCVRMSKDGRAVRSRISRTRRLSSRTGTHGDAGRGQSQDKGPQTSGIEVKVNKRKRPTAHLLIQQLKRSTPNRSSLFIDCDPAQPHLGWAWLELWTNARTWENRQLEVSKDYIIEINSSRKNSKSTTKEVNVNTLKMRYEDYISPKPAPAKPFSSRPFSEKKEPGWRAPMPSPVLMPGPPASSTTAHSHRAISKPSLIEVPSHPGVEVEGATQLELRTPEVQKSPSRAKSIPPAISPAGSGDSNPTPPSRHASDTSLPVSETPPGLDSAGHDPSVAMEHLVLPAAHRANGGEVNGALMSDSSSFSASNGGLYDQPGEDKPIAKGSASDVVNEHTSNGHQENGDNKARKGEKVGENGDSPIPSKRTTCRYMAATKSAKAKFRSASNPKTRTPDTPESPVRASKRYSIGSGITPVNKAVDSPKTAFGTRKSNSFQHRGSPSPKTKTGVPKEKQRGVETGAESPALRNSLGGADGKRWKS